MARTPGCLKVKKAANPHYAKDRAMARTLLPIVALGGGLAATPAAALELGDLTVHSNLGQPLRASIAYALAPNEMLSDTCVSVGGSTSGLPGIGRSAVSITERAILIAGEASIREPMLGTRVTINCPYTPNLSREYMLFVDPARVAQANEPVAQVAPAAPKSAPVRASETPAVIRNDLMEPIGQSTRYQAKPGDTLGDIVSRIENRSMKLWPAVNLIFQANPDAFIDNDPNKLKAGSWLTIPSLDGAAPVVADATPATLADAPMQEAPATSGAASVSDTSAGAAYDPTLVTQVPEALAEEAAVMDNTSDLRPGDVILDSDNPFVEPASSVVIPDTELPGPDTSATSPNVPTAVVSTGSRSESTSLLVWLIGGGLAIIAALLLFGRRARNRFGSTPVGPVINPSAAPVHEETEEIDAVAELDYDISDDSPTEENLALDADLVIGTGLEEGTDMDVAQDFGFASTTELDIELPFEPLAANGNSETDIIPPPSVEKMESILESEVLPEDDDYDMSVIMDATKMPHPEDVTERDLMAVKVGTDDEALISDNYTISKEVDYDILEQDYQEELTATQALNAEIARAAAELADDMDETVIDEETSEMPLATVTEIDVTAQLPTADEKTAEIEQPVNPNDTAAVTVNMSADDETAEMQVANDDETVEMDIEGGKVDTKRG